MSDSTTESERLDELADEFMEDYLQDFSSGVRHLVREAYKSGIIKAQANDSENGTASGVRVDALVSRFWKWVKRKLDLWEIDDLQIGAHCGLCGNYVEDEIIPKEWPITVCNKCKNG